MRTLDPYAVSPQDMHELISLQAFLDSSGLDESLIGESAERLAALETWKNVSVFTTIAWNRVEPSLS